jgi:hypothetical protein
VFFEPILRALEVFLHDSHGSSSTARGQEESLYPSFLAVHDALQAAERASTLWLDWPERTAWAMGNLRDIVNRLAGAWGVTELLVPEPARSETIRTLDRRYQNLIERPWLAAARAWSECPYRLGNEPCPADVAKVARTAKEQDVPPFLPLEQGRMRFLHADQLRKDSPRLGRIYPRLGANEYTILVSCYQTLSGVLMLREEAKVEAEIRAARAEPEPMPKKRNHRMPHPIGESP